MYNTINFNIKINKPTTITIEKYKFQEKSNQKYLRLTDLLAAKKKKKKKKNTANKQTQNTIWKYQISALEKKKIDTKSVKWQINNNNKIKMQ